MTSSRESADVTDVRQSLVEKKEEKSSTQDNADSLHKRRRGEPPASLSVKAPTTPSDAEGSSPCTAGLTPEDAWMDGEDLTPNTNTLCDSILKRLQDKNDPLSKRSKHLAVAAKNTDAALDQFERLLELLDEIIYLKERNARILRRLRDVERLKRMYEARKQIHLETKRLKAEGKELAMINEALDSEFDTEYSQGEALLENVLSGGRSMKRTGSKWKGHSRFAGSLLRKQRSRSAGGEDSDVPTTPLRRLSEGISKEVDKSKVSKWTKVKSAFRWEKAQWPLAGAAGAVAAGALVGAVALAGSAPSPSYSGIAGEPPRDSASLTPGSLISLTPNSSCEELRMDSGSCRKSGVIRCEDNENFLQAPIQDDSSTSPSPNKLHKSAWGKMRDIIQTRRESVRKKTGGRGSKSSPDVVPSRRRSLSDGGGDSDAPPALTLTIPSSEELESEPCHPLLRKQRSLELGAAGRPPQHRPPRASKWSKVKRAFLTSASASVPSSPNRHSAFFTDAETEAVSSGCEASAVREEIARDYAALQSRLRREFSDRRGKLYATSRPVATEEQLSADFRKKLAEWQTMKGGATKQPPPVPARQDLSEDFLKKWDEWKRMKETNAVPTWEEGAKPDEVLVQTSTGLFKFQGISRSFTRKLHEWEKSRGIKPEASTSALLQAARARVASVPQSPLTRAQSDGSVAPSAAGSGRLHASSLSVNDADDFDLDFERDNHSLDGEDVCDGDSARGAVLVEVEAEEVCTAAPLVAVSPRHTPQKPVYTYGHAEARLLCETSSAITGTAIVQPNGTGCRDISKRRSSKSTLASREQSRAADTNRRKLARQQSLEEDAKYIRRAIEEIEKASTSRCDDRMLTDDNKSVNQHDRGSSKTESLACKSSKQDVDDQYFERKYKGSVGDLSNISKVDDKVKDSEKGNGKKKTKSRARLEREQSKPSESDSEPDVDTVTVEIPKRRKRLRRISDKPRTPPASVRSDSEGEVFVLKLKAPEPREGSPEVIVKTTRKIFSPVVRSGESVARAVIPVDVEDLADVRPLVDTPRRASMGDSKKRNELQKREKVREELSSRSLGSGDLNEGEDQIPKTRPPLPLSPSAQRRPPAKETAPSIRIMIQRYNMKIKEEEGHTSGASSGASSPAWRSPALERRRPLDMPAGVNIRNNPFLEREVQKSASASQLSSKREQTSPEKRLEATPTSSLEGVLKSHSACALHPVEGKQSSIENCALPCKHEDKGNLLKSEGTIMIDSASTDTIIPKTLNTSNMQINEVQTNLEKNNDSSIMRHTVSDVVVPSLTRVAAENPSSYFGRSISAVETPLPSNFDSETIAVARCSERAKKIREARERFLASPGPSRIRRIGTGSASDLRPGDRSSRISCDSDVAEGSNGARGTDESGLGRSASTGMVNVDREAWDRVAEGTRKDARSPRNRFSLARLAAKLRRRDEGAVSRLCRQSLLVQLKNKP